MENEDTVTEEEYVEEDFESYKIRVFTNYMKREDTRIMQAIHSFLEV